MISRSDGNSFHLLLADRPVPYPNERSSEPTRKVSVCFWYAHVSRPQITLLTVVTLCVTETTRHGTFRSIELIADLLAATLARTGVLAQFYHFTGDALFELST